MDILKEGKVKAIKEPKPDIISINGAEAQEYGTHQ